MTIEEVKEELKKFDKFKFFSNGHYYECNGRRVGVSGTWYVGKVENEFEEDIIAEKCAIKAGKETYEILEEWEYKNQFACAKGSNGHAMAQSLWSGITEPLDRFDNSEAYKPKTFMKIIKTNMNTSKMNKLLEAKNMILLRQ